MNDKRCPAVTESFGRQILSLSTVTPTCPSQKRLPHAAKCSRRLLPGPGKVPPNQNHRDTEGSGKSSRAAITATMRTRNERGRRVSGGRILDIPPNRRQNRAAAAYLRPRRAP